MYDLRVLRSHGLPPQMLHEVAKMTTIAFVYVLLRPVAGSVESSLGVYFLDGTVAMSLQGVEMIKRCSQNRTVSQSFGSTTAPTASSLLRASIALLLESSQQRHNQCRLASHFELHSCAFLLLNSKQSMSISLTYS